MKILFAALLIFAIQFSFAQENQHIRFSIIYLIHGDADYLYHDTSGTEHISDKEILKQAIDVGKNLSNAEVFIFHQKKKNRFLFFPEDDADFYFFRKGNEITEESYRRNKADEDFDEELQFYNKFKNNNSESIHKILLYFGHEIPSENDEVNSYNITHQEIRFNKNIFADVVGNFTQANLFDLVVLSTCNNGTPEMISLLTPYTKFIIASPENLHLSQMNSLSLKNLESGNYDLSSFAYSFAENAFNALKKNTLTVITISIYDTEETSSYVKSVLNYPDKFQNESSPDNCDCAEINSYKRNNMENGVTVFYNPPMFGKNKNKKTHSGWGCRK